MGGDSADLDCILSTLTIGVILSLLLMEMTGRVGVERIPVIVSPSYFSTYY